MLPKLHPAVFLGAVILLCSVWLWVRPPVSAIETAAPARPRPAVVQRKSIELGQALLERYVGQYEGRGGFIVELTLKDGKLLAQGGGAMPSWGRESSPVPTHWAAFALSCAKAMAETGWSWLTA